MQTKMLINGDLSALADEFDDYPDTGHVMVAH